MNNTRKNILKVLKSRLECVSDLYHYYMEHDDKEQAIIYRTSITELQLCIGLLEDNKLFKEIAQIQHIEIDDKF